MHAGLERWRFLLGGLLVGLLVATAATVRGSEAGTYLLYLPLTMAERCVASELEPNDNFSFARNNGSFCSDEYIYAQMPYNDNNDYFMVRVLAAGNLVVDLTNIPASVDFDLAVYNDEQSVIAQSRASNTTPEHVEVAVEPGEYFVRVFPFGSSRDNDEFYRLRWVMVFGQ